MSGFPLRHVRFPFACSIYCRAGVVKVDKKGFSGGVREHIFNLNISKLLKSASMLVSYKKEEFKPNIFKFINNDKQN
jgi:hypothetical protein